jgi:hypothetical protein
MFYLCCFRYFRGGDGISAQILNETDDIKTQKCSVIVIRHIRYSPHFTYRQGCGSGSGSAWIRINLSCWIRIRIQEGKNDPQKSTELSCFEVLDVLF